MKFKYDSPPVTCTVKTAVLLCELNPHITHFLRVLLQVHELMQCVLPEMRTQYGLIQHVLAASLMVHTSKCVFFLPRMYTTTHLMCVRSMRESRINTLQAEVHARRITHFPKQHTKSYSLKSVLFLFQYGG